MLKCRAHFDGRRVGLTTSVFDSLFLTNYGQINLVITRAFGGWRITLASQRYSLRVWVNPDKIRPAPNAPDIRARSAQNGRIQPRFGIAHPLTAPFPVLHECSGTVNGLSRLRTSLSDRSRCFAASVSVCAGGLGAQVMYFQPLKLTSSGMFTSFRRARSVRRQRRQHYEGSQAHVSGRIDYVIPYDSTMFWHRDLRCVVTW